MDKAIERYLARRGIRTTTPLADERSFSERAPRFFEWFHHSVLGLDTGAYRKAFWREAYRTGHTIGHVPYTLDSYLRRRGAAYRQDMANLLAYALLMGGSFAAWVMRRQIDRHIRRLKRPGYYEAELARRKALAEERRKLRKRRTLNPCPTDDALRSAFGKAKDSPADMVRFGSLLEDLECYVDNSAIFDGSGNIAGRRGGIRRYLELNIPELAVRYKTVMRYKALAKKFRQALGIKDPIPAAMLLPEADAGDKAPHRPGTVETPGNGGARRGKRFREFASVQNLDAAGAAEIERADGGSLKEVPAETRLKADTEKPVGAGKPVDTEKPMGARKPVDTETRLKVETAALQEVRAEAERLLAGCEGACVSLMAALAVRTSPDYAPRAEGGMQMVAERMAAANSELLDGYGLGAHGGGEITDTQGLRVSGAGA